MILKRLFLQNFRNYKKADFKFDNEVTIVVGKNASGKSNMVEGIFFLAMGKGRRAESDKYAVHFGENFCRLKGELDVEGEELQVLMEGGSSDRLRKRFLVNGVGKRRVDFAGRLSVVLFTPVDIEIVIGQPGGRRRFLDEILEQVDYEYRQAVTMYGKVLRQRNALLERAREAGVKNRKLFDYWDELLIRNGKLITERRGDFIEYVNGLKKELFDFRLVYDKSEVSVERLRQYDQAEVGAGVTLVGPHRDDIKFSIFPVEWDPASQGNFQFSNNEQEVRSFASRGQQRLVVLELKLAQILFMRDRLGVPPLLLLDDIFSELDEDHIGHVLERVKRHQVIITTTHEDFVPVGLRGEGVGVVVLD